MKEIIIAITAIIIAFGFEASAITILFNCVLVSLFAITPITFWMALSIVFVINLAIGLFRKPY